MKNILLFFFISMISLTTYSQTYLMVDDYTVINPSAPGNCDGSIIIHSLPVEVTDHVVYYGNSTSTIFYSNSDTISGLCEDVYLLMISDQNGRSNFTTLYLEATSGDPFGFAIDSMIINPESSLGACDGNILISSNVVDIGSSVNVYDPISSAQYLNTTITTDPEVATGLCMPPVNELNVDYYGFQVNLNNNQGTTCIGCILTNSLSGVQNSTTLSSCDGSATLLASGGIPPYTYDVSDGSSINSSASATVTNLCPGTYTYTITDDAGNSIGGSFVIGNNTPSNPVPTEMIIADYSATNPSSISACDGSIHVNSIFNGVAPYSFNLFKDNSILHVSTSPHFYNLCDGLYLLTIIDSDCKIQAIGITMESTTGNPESMTVQNMTLLDETSMGACDGSLQFSVNNFVMGLPLLFNDAFAAGSYINSNLTSNPMIIPNTCTNPELGYMLYVNDVLDENYAFLLGQDVSTLYPYWSTFNNACGGFYAWTETNPSTDTLTCDGTAVTTVFGGVPPYDYLYSSGGTSYTETGLCPGFHTVLITDANGDTATTSFVVTDSIHLYEMYFWGNPYDTLFTNAVQNCTFDYTLPIDTAILDSVIYESAYDLAVYYTIVQGSNQYLWSEAYHIDSIANYMISMSFYCESRSFDDVYSILAPLLLADMMALGIPKQSIQPIDLNAKIYPNPVEDILTTSFKLEKQSDVILSITDITGKNVMTKSIKANAGNNSVQMDVNDLSNGIYLVNYSVNGQKIQSLKMIKE